MMDKVSEWEEDSEKMEAKLNDPAELAELYQRIYENTHENDYRIIGIK